MGDWESIPRKIGERWAYAGDSIARRGFQRAGSPKNSDIGTQITEFSGSTIQFDNYARSFNTTSGMLGRQPIRNKREDSVGKILEEDYDGILIEIGVNDLGSGGGGQERWKRSFSRMQRNIVDMYLRVYLKGAGGRSRSAVLERIDSELAKIGQEKKDVFSILNGEEGRKSPVSAMRAREKLEELEIREMLLPIIQKRYAELFKTKKSPKKKVKRVVFVEVAPWNQKNEPAAKAAEKAKRTKEYNSMLRELSQEFNRIFGGIGGPEASVAELGEALGSKEDKSMLYSGYLGKKVDGKNDYLHFGKEGRRAAAAAITLQIFPNHAQNPKKLRTICSQNKREKRPGPLARR